MPETVQKASRGASPILLVLAALCFLLPFVGVSCNTSAGGAALGSALSAAGGSSSGGTAAAATACLQSLNGKDLATYSGVNLLTGGNPSTSTSIPGCDTSSTSTATSTNEGGVGVQPLVLIAFILIVVGIAAAVLRAPLRGLVSGGAAFVAGVLLIVNNATVHTQIINKLTQGSGGSSLSSLGISGAADQFFNIHAALGFYLVLVALLLALLVNAVAAAAGSGLRLSTAGAGGGAGPPAGNAPPAYPPGPAPPPEPPPSAG